MFTNKIYSHFLLNILSTYLYASTQAFEFSLFCGSFLKAGQREKEIQ